MGRLQKRKDPKKKKKTVESASAPVADKQPEKSSFASMVKSSVSLKKNNAAGSVRKPVKPVKKETESGVRGIFEKSVQFLREVRVELKKVTWPSRKQTIGSTAVVLLMVIMVSIFLAIVDFGLSSLVRLVIG